MNNSPSEIELHNNQLSERDTAQILTLYRNMGFGAAATCLIILLSIAQIRETHIALKISTFSAIIGIPPWLLLSLIYDHHLVIGKQIYGHIETPFMGILIRILILFGGLGLVFAVVGITYFLDPIATLVLLVIGLVEILGWFLFLQHLGRWYVAQRKQ
jgi:hypothetical protein